MELFVIGLTVDEALALEIEELADPIRRIIELSDKVSNPRLFDWQELAQYLARELATGEPTGLVFHREASESRLIASVAALLTHFTSTFPHLITVDGGWDRKACRFIYHVVQVDHLKRP